MNTNRWDSSYPHRCPTCGNEATGIAVTIKPSKPDARHRVQPAGPQRVTPCGHEVTTEQVEFAVLVTSVEDARQ